MSAGRVTGDERLRRVMNADARFPNVPQRHSSLAEGNHNRKLADGNHNLIEPPFLRLPKTKSPDRRVSHSEVRVLFIGVMADGADQPTLS